MVAEAEGGTLPERGVAFYSAMVQAWVDTRMELDRTIVTLSAGGVGLLATLLTTVGVTRSWHLWLYGTATLGFLSALVLALTIFQGNAALIEEAIGIRKGRTVVRTMDRDLWLAFSVGTAGLLAIGTATAITRIGDEGMKKLAVGNPEETRPAPAPLKKSLDGVQNLAPKEAAPQPQTSNKPTPPPSKAP